MDTRIIITFLMLLVAGRTTAQDHGKTKNPPVMVETVVGSRGVQSQIIMDKSFQSLPKFGFFNVSSIVGEWGEREVKDGMVQSYLTYNIYKGLKVNAGFLYASPVGILPSGGLMYTYGSQRFTAVVFQRIDLADKPNTESIVLLEYKPRISEKLDFYSRVQGQYIHHISTDTHTKSAIFLRAGLKYREFTFGAAFNADYYGPDKTIMNNIGGFLGVALF
ncbi:hypothetical protein [Sphingobacterium daejeonense]|uniref:hypothetical protein n=1 Tax=Sphingobacterium daejeonense TaxID=371142 RepID=UPI0010C36557|nr:hypothetical protein [Sphingobacterium daejeonense]VTP91743.1 Uncharacterised protein [Sphingobacterium daejeonense]